MNLDYIVQAAQSAPLPLRGNAAKEALQRCLLTALQQQSLLTDVAFIGGTALRLLHNLPRYSEDLDFIWRNPDAEKNADKWGNALSKALTKLGASGDVAKKDSVTDGPAPKRQRAIYLSAASPAFRAFAPNGLQISFEIDFDPPAQTECEAKTLIIAGNQVTVPTLTLPSLMAGKLHILLTRRDREKGRDWFDYAWYRQKGILPNLAQLDSAIHQTSTGPEGRYWMSYLRARAQTVNWLNIRADVKPFLEDASSVDQLNEKTISNLTPYPDFERITAELHRLKKQHPLLLTENPVVADINQAASEGDDGAIEAAFAVKELGISESKNAPDQELDR